MGPDATILVFSMLSFKSVFSLSSFTFIKRLFSSSSLSAIRVVSFAYLRLLVFLLVISIPSKYSLVSLEKLWDIWISTGNSAILPASLVAQWVKNLPAMQETPVPSPGRSPGEGKWLPTPVFLAFPGGSDCKESVCNVGDLGSVPGSGRSPGRGHGNPL